MPAAKSHLWRRIRVHFRRFRITVLLALLGVVCALLYLEVVGLPQFAKRRVIEELQSHGLELEFSRLRLDWYHGIVADEVRFGRSTERPEPRLTAKRVSIHPDLAALAGLRFRVDAVGLRQGRIEWPVTEADAGLSALNVEDIEAGLRFSSGGEWTLDEMRARFAGADISISGNLNNAQAIRHWEWFNRRRPETPAVWLEQLRKVADVIRRVSFSEPPSVRLVLSGDALTPETIAARLYATMANPRTPWGQANRLELFGRLLPDWTNGLPVAELSIEATGVRSQWGDANRIELAATLLPEPTNWLAHSTLNLDATTVRTPWGDADRIKLASTLLARSTNWIENSTLNLDAATVRTRWGDAHHVALQATIRAHPEMLSQEELMSLGPWAHALPWAAGWMLKADGVNVEPLTANRVALGGDWLPPRLVVTNLFASLGGGVANANASLNVADRHVEFALDSTVDPKAIESLLTPRTQVWMSSFSWESNPHLRGSGSVTLPAWTNRQPDWRGEVRPTLRLAGAFAGTNVAYRGVQADWARSTFTYTNLVWNLPDLQMGRPEGTLLLAHQEDDSTRDYQWHVRGPVDPRALRPLLSSNQLRGFDLVRFESPVVIEGRVFGRLNDYERIGFDVAVAVSNVAVRGHAIDTFASQARYTNLVLEFFKPVITRGAQWMYADGIAVDFTMQRIHFTNGFSMADAQAVADAIGPKVGKALQPYRFIHPPVARVEGFAPLKGSEDADLRFQVDGGPFEWWKFNTPRIEGNVHWLGRSLLLTNVLMDFYGGNAGGHAIFDFHEEQGADFQFALNVTNSDFHSLMTDIASASNRMSGVLSGQLVVTSASTTDPFSWNGHGKVKLEDGYLWDIPLFGVFSPILNNVIPGMGGGHASEAKANFIITNGVVFSDSLDIRSTMMRLKYDGTVDFAGTVDARVEAELLRDAWLVGRALSFVFKPVTKLLEYRVTGTLSKPKPEPLYFIPRLLMFPLHPIRTLEEILPSTPSSTNAPATRP